MGAPFAILPMYDWPEVRAATDRLWTALATALATAGIDTPRRLDRERALPDAWLSPDLLLGQTCGMPYRRLLRDRVALVGAPDYGLEECPPGWYRSVLVARADDGRRQLPAFKGARLAFNDTGSQSGFGALAVVIRDLAPDGAFFRGALRTGAHRESIRAVAAGRADLAAIDAVSWRLALAHEPTARSLWVVDLTPPTPGLPFIARRGSDVGRLSAAAAAGIAALDRETGSALGLVGFAPLVPDDYAVIDPAVSLDDLVERSSAPAPARCPLPA